MKGFKAILAADETLGIGKDGDLPWHAPGDLAYFKRMTVGDGNNAVIMGRKTFESLLHQNGGPLPNRENVVLTRHPTRVDHPGIHVYSGLTEALDAFADAERVFIGGGAGVYRSVLDEGLADRLELTFVEGEFSGDTFFPPYRHLLTPQGGPYELASRERFPAVDGRPAFRFDTYKRIRGHGTP